MNKLVKNIMIMIMISTSSYSYANSKTTVLLSENVKGNFTMEFLNENDVTAMQFDIVLSKKNFKKSNIGTCVVSLPKSHMGTCKIKENILRVIVFSTDNSVLESGEIGTIKLNNYNYGLQVDKVEFVKQDASIINGDVLVDRKFQPVIENINNK